MAMGPMADRPLATGGDAVMGGYEETPVIRAAKRLGVQWTPWMGDWFTSWSPRNDNQNAEGTWEEWAHLAASILAHPMTAKVAPALHRTDIPFDPDIYTLDQKVDADEIPSLIAEGRKALSDRVKPADPGDEL